MAYFSGMAALIDDFPVPVLPPQPGPAMSPELRQLLTPVIVTAPNPRDSWSAMLERNKTVVFAGLGVLGVVFLAKGGRR